MTREEILAIYDLLKETNQTVPSTTIEFMRDVSLRELEKIKNGRECFSCKHDGLQALSPSACTGCGADGELRNFKVKL